jgi:hypothetical protein
MRLTKAATGNRLRCACATFDSQRYCACFDPGDATESGSTIVQRSRRLSIFAYAYADFTLCHLIIELHDA